VATSPAIDALRAFIPFTQHTYEHDPTHPSFGLEAAESLGVDPHQVFKTLVWRAGPQPVIAIVAVTDSVDAKALARAAGVRKDIGTRQGRCRAGHGIPRWRHQSIRTAT
jgi:Cys-tRNA(Pro)/Cys-tRNA(Cys) deacylase